MAAGVAGEALISLLVGIVDYGMGNLTPVKNSFAAVSAPAEVLRDPKGITAVAHLVLPGVGAFGDGMKYLSERGWVSAMKQFAFDAYDEWKGFGCLRCE